MAQIRRKEKGRETLKKRWLFNLKDDPTETTDLSGSEPAKLNVRLQVPTASTLLLPREQSKNCRVIDYCRACIY